MGSSGGCETVKDMDLLPGVRTVLRRFRRLMV